MGKTLYSVNLGFWENVGSYKLAFWSEASNTVTYSVNFLNGFIDSPRSNLRSGSSFTGYSGLYLTKTESLFKYTAQNSTGWANKLTALKAAKYTAIAGKSLGVAGVGLTALEDYNENGKIGIGTGVKIAIGLATTFAVGAAAPVAIAYAILDIGVGLTTGTTLTDRIANGVESAINN